MKTFLPVLGLAGAVAALWCAGCAGPRLQPVTELPSGGGLVFIYAFDYTAGGCVNHNGKKMVSLGPRQYCVHAPTPGANRYSFPVDFFSRGGLIGLMVPQGDPQPTSLDVEAGKTYYLKLMGSGAHAGLWRVEADTARAELQQCRRVPLGRDQAISSTAARKKP